MKSLRFEVVGEAFKKHPIDLELPAERPSEYYGINVFNKEKMYKYLPADAFKQMVNVMEKGAVMERTLADKVAEGMKKWAMDLGATHYTHWFHPLTDTTAAKHDAFIEYDG